MEHKKSLILDAADLDFCLYDWLDVESLSGYERFSEHNRETFEGLIDLAREVAEEYFAPHNRKGDLQEPRLVDDKVELIPEVKKALTAFAEAGFLGATMDAEYGGFQVPTVVYRAAFMWFQAANVGTVSYALLTTAAANLIREHASAELAAKFLPPMLDGRWTGTMNLSEPGIGSALGDLTTSAVRAADGTYRVRGDKMWISAGDHELSENIVHLVLARTGGPGVKGLSLFIVPKWLGEAGALTDRNDVSLVGVNHKMGYRGTVNTALSYGSGAFPVGGEPGAVGYLIGEEGRGLHYMFLMMNEARLGVGASAVALGTTGFLHAREYARERIQGKELGAKDPAAPAVPIIRHPDVRRMLMLAKAYAQGGTALILYAGKLLDESEAETDAAKSASLALLLDVLTPIAKSWSSQWGLAANDIAIQVLGGSGYVRDFPVEQFYRDNRLNPIHEGTHGIQALDLLGRKVLLDGGSGLADLLGRMRATLDRVGASEPELARLVGERVARIEGVTRTLWEDGESTTALANAAHYLEAVGDTVVAWLFLDQLGALGGVAPALAAEKRATARFFITHVLPRVDASFDLLGSGDRQLVDLDEALI
ncbi:butyryl-CoA dehydrogenase [Leucobacter komagatae]|uniref:Butyryl-CoA dehydrogenase n=1 Tax=Leucobacter komagatae TaxID=55969 RepID=A0A542Y9X2_9MICO|nr:acyl-CoA dehydrogenase [Leucobacter komagatae]TQL44847.1 butyryl-CoA dehydrogenase [Leucobacter komagatae]